MLLAAGLLAGCGAAATTRPPASPAPTTASAASTTRQVSETDDRTTVGLRTGGTLRVVLHSTYWQIDPASDPTVLSSEGRPSASPDPPGSCVPGGGCGTVTATLRALRPGRAVVSAHRTSCGEALRCTGDRGGWTVTVVVSG